MTKTSRARYTLEFKQEAVRRAKHRSGDLNSLLSLSGRHLVWPLPALQRLREFLNRRCRATSSGTSTKTCSRCSAPPATGLATR